MAAIRNIPWILPMGVLLAWVAGCVEHVAPAGKGSRPTSGPVISLAATPVSEPQVMRDTDLESVIFPPADWKAEPVKRSARHVHKTWVSSTGQTAYGVIRFQLPLPVSTEFALWGFMREMRRTQGDAVLLEKALDPTLKAAGDTGGMRFIVEGGRYRLRANLMVRGVRGWCVYAGTLRGEAENLAELTDAVLSREETRMGVSGDAGVP